MTKQKSQPAELNNAIEYTDARFDVSITIRPATMSDALRRLLWKSEAAKQPVNDTATDYLRVYVHPDLCAAIDETISYIKIDGVAVDLPLNWQRFDALPELPEALLERWLKASGAINPHWGEELSKKKATT